MTPEKTKIIIATHGELACAFLAAVETIIGRQSAVSCISLLAGDAPQTFRGKLISEIAANASSLILVDIPGGTPWNVASALASHATVMASPATSIRVVSGVNLSMLIELLLAGQGLTVDQLADLAVKSGIEAITASRHPEATG